MGKRKFTEVSGGNTADDESAAKRQRLKEPAPEQQPLRTFLLVLAPQLGVPVLPEEDGMEGVEFDHEADGGTAADNDAMDAEDELDEDFDAEESEDESEHESDKGSASELEPQPGQSLPSDEVLDDDAIFDPRRLDNLPAMVLRSGTQLTRDGPLTAEGLPRRLPALSVAQAQEAFNEALGMRNQRRNSFDVSERKPTFYTYMVTNTGKAYSRLFTATPHTDVVAGMAQEARQADPDFSVELDTPYSLDATLQVPDRPTKVSGNTDLYKDHVTTAAQGPHSLAHVLIEEMLQHGLPQEPTREEEPDAAKRWDSRQKLWHAVEEMYLSQVDSPETFRRQVQGELGRSAQPNPRVEFAVQRHQELINHIEGLLTLHSARSALVRSQSPGNPASWLEAQLDEDGEDVDEAHNVLGELIELAPFGSYAWHDGKKATSAQLGAKGERRQGLEATMTALRTASSPAQMRKAIDDMADLLANLFDYEKGQFVDLDGYQAFLLTRFELAGAPDLADLILARVLKLKQAS